MERLGPIIDELIDKKITSLVPREIFVYDFDKNEVFITKNKKTAFKIYNEYVSSLRLYLKNSSITDFYEKKSSTINNVIYSSALPFIIASVPYKDLYINDLFLLEDNFYFFEDTQNYISTNEEMCVRSIYSSLLKGKDKYIVFSSILDSITRLPLIIIETRDLF